MNPITSIGFPIPGSFRGDAAATTYIFTPDLLVRRRQVRLHVPGLPGAQGPVGQPARQPAFVRSLHLRRDGHRDGDRPRRGLHELRQPRRRQQRRPRLGVQRGGSPPGAGDHQPRDVPLRATPSRAPARTTSASTRPSSRPFAGAALNQYVSGVNPPTSEGRRVMWAFSDDEMGSNGSVTAAGWGPDSNATFAAIYPSVFLRAGYQKTQSISLSPSFDGNYDGKATVVYTGPYQVAQAQNVGNTDRQWRRPRRLQHQPGLQRQPQRSAVGLHRLRAVARVQHVLRVERGRSERPRRLRVPLRRERLRG